MPSPINKKNKAIEEFIKKFVDSLKEDSLRFREQYDEILSKLASYVSGSSWEDGYITNGRQSELKAEPVVNYAHLIVKQNLKNLQYKIDIALLPKNPEESEATISLNLILNTLWARANAERYLKNAARDAFTFPISITRMDYNDNKLITVGDKINKGEVVFSNIDPANFFWDSRATDIEDCEFVFEITKVSYNYLKNQPKFDIKLVNQVLVNEWTNLTEKIQIDLYKGDFEVFVDKYVFGLTEIHFSYDINSTRPKIAKIYMVLDQVLYQVDDIGTKILPYSIFKEFSEPHEFYGSNSILKTLSNQELLNKLEAIKNNIANQMQSPTILVSVSSNLDVDSYALVNGEPGLIMTVKGNPAEAVFQLKPPEVTEQLNALSASTKQDIRDIAGITEYSMGNSVGSLTSSGGMDQVAEQNANKGTNVKIEYKYFVKRLVQIMINVLAKHGVDQSFRIDTIDPEDPNSFGFMSYTKEFALLTPDINIGVYMSKYEKEEEKRTVMSLLQLQTQTGVQYVSPADALSIMVGDGPNRELLISHFQQREEAKQEQEQALMIAVKTGVQYAVEQISKTEEEGGAPNSTNYQEIENAAVSEGVQAGEKASQQISQQESSQSGGGIQGSQSAATGGAQNGAIGANQ